MQKNKIIKIVAPLLSLAFLLTPMFLVHSAGLISCGGYDVSGTVDQCHFGDIFETINNIIRGLILIAIPFAALLLSYAGYLYLTSAGDGGKVKKAHEIFKNVGVGLVIMLSAWLIINTILSALVKSEVYSDVINNVQK